MKPVAAIGQSPIEGLKGKPGETLELEKARLKKATQEFESFFRYQMLKAMRKTVPESPLSEGLPLNGSQGKETFLDLMDMEISRAGTGGHGSIADILYRSTEKLIEAKYAKAEKAAASALPSAPVKRPAIRLEKPAIKLPAKTNPVPLKETNTPIPVIPRVLSAHSHIMNKFGDHIEAAAAETKLDSALIAAVIRAESSGNPNAVSPAGAKGLMQLADTTAKDYGVTNSFDPDQNIRAGSRFLKALMNRYQDLRLALAAYNAGPGNVDKYGGLPPFKETREYVRKVMSFLQDGS